MGVFPSYQTCCGGSDAQRLNCRTGVAKVARPSNTGEAQPRCPNDGDADGTAVAKPGVTGATIVAVGLESAWAASGRGGLMPPDWVGIAAACPVNTGVGTMDGTTVGTTVGTAVGTGDATGLTNTVREGNDTDL